MIDAILKLLHLLAVVVWVGGMVFAQFFLRPALAVLPAPEQRVRLMHAVLGRFFGAVLVAVLAVLVSGLWMIGRVARATAQAGGAFAMPLDWSLMAALGLVMVAIFGHIRFALYRRLTRAVQARDWPAGAAALAAIRQWVALNLALGLAIIALTLLMG